MEGGQRDGANHDGFDPVFMQNRHDIFSGGVPASTLNFNVMVTNGATLDIRKIPVAGITTVETGSTLTIVAVTRPTGSEYVIISNDGVDAVTGTYTGLARGALVMIGAAQYVVSYSGGDGNDVTLRR